MLRDVLLAIKDSGMVDLSELAAKMATTVPMVEQALNTLLTKGYLSQINSPQSCGASCMGCHGNCKTDSCKDKNAYFLTEKGRKYLTLPPTEHPLFHLSGTQI
jgi:hypothetical protein